MVDIATGAVPDVVDDGKDEGAAAMGRKGGVARAKKLTPTERREASAKAANTRWSNKLSE